MGLIHVADVVGAIALTELLNGNRRRRPVVEGTGPAGRREPYIAAEQVWDEVGDQTDVYVLATGPHTWTFSAKMPELTQVYGAAGRAYPVGHEWVSNRQRAPLRFAYSSEEGQRATRELVSDALAEGRSRGSRPAHAGDNLSWLGTWDCELDAVAAPGHLFYGAADAMVPAVHGEWLAGRLPNATLTIAPEAGHGEICFGAGEQMFSILNP